MLPLRYQQGIHTPPLRKREDMLPLADEGAVGVDGGYHPVHAGGVARAEAQIMNRRRGEGLTGLQVEAACLVDRSTIPVEVGLGRAAYIPAA